MEILCLEAPDAWRLPCTTIFLNEENSVQGSLFILHDHLGVKRVEIVIPSEDDKSDVSFRVFIL